MWLFALGAHTVLGADITHRAMVGSRTRWGPGLGGGRARWGVWWGQVAGSPASTPLVPGSLWAQETWGGRSPTPQGRQTHLGSSPSSPSATAPPPPPFRCLTGLRRPSLSPRRLWKCERAVQAACTERLTSSQASLWPGTLGGKVERGRAALCGTQSHAGVGASPQGAEVPLDSRDGIGCVFQTGRRLPAGWVERRLGPVGGPGGRDGGRAISVEETGLASTALLTLGIK